MLVNRYFPTDFFEGRGKSSTRPVATTPNREHPIAAWSRMREEAKQTQEKELSMPKQATPVVLSEQEEQGLLQITRRHRSEQQVVLRARIVLAAAQGSSNARIARELGVNVDTVRLWRDRWVGLQGIDLETLSLGERLQDAPRPGATPKFTTEQRCQMAVLACEAPSQAGRPISQWTGREIAGLT